MTVALMSYAYDYVAPNGLCYNINADGKTATVINVGRSIGTLTELTIPAEITSVYTNKRYTVTAIAVADGFYNPGSSLKSLTLPNTINTIGDNAFYSFKGLTSVVIPESVTSIGTGAFKGCDALNSVVIGDGVASIGTEAFAGCVGLTSVTLGNGLTSIGVRAFSQCSSLTRIDIPSSVTRIESEAFNGCTALIDISIPNSVTYIGFCAFGDPTNPLGKTTPWYRNQPDLVYAGRVLYRNKVVGGKSITIKEGTISITPGAFSDCTKLQSIIIPESVTHIGDFAFRRCSDLKVVSILGNQLKEIGAGAFEHCTNLSSINLPSSLTSIGSFAFSQCFKFSVPEFPNSLINVGPYAFYNTYWLNSQPDGLVYAGRVAYCYKGEMPSGTTIRFKDGTVGISESAFIVGNPYNEGTAKAYKNLTKIVIPNSVSYIGEYAFQTCENLASVSIGNGVKTIGDGAFSGCSNLSELIIGDAVNSIGTRTFSGCENLVSIALPESLRSIGEYAFIGCSSLAALALPDSLHSIGMYAFARCPLLREITIPDNVFAIGTAPFSDCTGLRKVSIGKSLFEASSLITPFSGYSVNFVKWNAKRVNGGGNNGPDIFKECHASTFVLGDSVEYIPPYFAYKSRVKSVTVGKSVKWINKYAFYECPRLRTIKSHAPVPPRFMEGRSNFKGSYGADLPIKLYVPAKYIPVYKTYAVWKDFIILPLGDTNGDSVVDIGDLSTVVDIILQKSDSDDAADLNSDGLVDIDDLNYILNIILGK